MVYICKYCKKSFNKTRDYNRHMSFNKRSGLPNCPILKRDKKCENMLNESKNKVIKNENDILSNGKINEKFHIIKKYWLLHIESVFSNFEEYKQLREKKEKEFRYNNPKRYFKYFKCNKKGLPYIKKAGCFKVLILKLKLKIF